MSETGGDPSELAEGTLVSHLLELRDRLMKAMLAVFVCFIPCAIYMNQLFTFVAQPLIHKLPAVASLIATSVVSPFMVPFKLAFVIAFGIAIPVVLYQAWAFVAPGLYRHEKRYVLPFMVSTIGLFLAGGYFGYKVVLPQALVFLIGYGKDFQPMITLTEYSSLFLTIIVGLGIIFEMPILIFFLALMGIVSASFMWRNIRYAILLIFVVAGIVSPTPDILNMCIFAAPMVALYVMSIAIAWRVHPAQRNKRAEKKNSG